MVKNPPATAGDITQVPSLSQEDPLEEGTATHSSILAWRIPLEPGGLQSMGSQVVGHNLSDLIHTHTQRSKQELPMYSVHSPLGVLPFTLRCGSITVETYSCFMGATPWCADHLPPYTGIDCAGTGRTSPALAHSPAAGRA